MDGQFRIRRRRRAMRKSRIERRDFVESPTNVARRSECVFRFVEFPVRYLKVTLIIGLATALLVTGLFEAHVFHRLNLGLAAFLGRKVAPGFQRGVQYPLFIFMAFAFAWTTVDISRPSLKAVVAVGALLQLVTAVWVFNLYHVFFSPFPSVCAVTVSFLAGFVYSRGETGSRKRILRQILGDRVSNKTFLALLDSET